MGLWDMTHWKVLGQLYNYPCVRGSHLITACITYGSQTLNLDQATS